MHISHRLPVRQIGQKLTALSSIYLALLLFVVVPFFEYCLNRTSIVHYYLGDGLGNYIGLIAALWAATSVFILLSTGFLKVIPLLFLAVGFAYYIHYFPYPAFSVALVLGLMYLVKLDTRAIFVANSLVHLLGLVILLYAVFGVHSDRAKPPTKPINTVVLIFDEFGIEQIGGYRLLEDKSEFPNFSRLMATSDVYHNAIANNSHTEKAVPAIIAGRHANVMGGGFYGGASLFELFKQTHNTHIVELVNTFNHQFKGSLPDKLGGLFKHYHDSVYRAPRTDEISDLVTIAASPDKFSTDRSRLPTTELIKVTRSDNRPFFYFNHLLAPHRPYQWNSARFYNQNDIADRLFYSELDENSNSLTNMANLRERYIDQLKRMDLELGRLMDALRTAGVFDDTAIILTSDHGVSFDPGKSARQLQPGNEASIQLVPLIVKKRAQSQRRDDYELISNLSVHHMALEANGGAREGGLQQPSTGYECFKLFNCIAAPVKGTVASNAAEYEKRVAKHGAQFGRQLLSEQVLASAVTVPDLPDDVSDYVEVELGAGNLDSVKVGSDYYPFNLVFSLHGTASLGKTLYAFVDNKPCGSIEIDKIQEKYSIYCSRPFPQQAEHVDFYLFDGKQLNYLPKKLGYGHFSSSQFSGAWREIRNAAPATYLSPFSEHRIHLAANHREIIFVDGKTGNIRQRVVFPRDFDFDAVHLYDANFLLTSKTPGKVLVFNYQK
ncbi:sulfatase-like hydrolase/transferase [Laribacter hongkongensis]|uniref:sulfatase-like hydrolase/transferase n=1 Tax=Laribacter hongkongensis TaxID=168471 RepID=UPI001EFE5863|nr:sulfatase-like hydrolase/transferase [Laribacter hongkongensis]MCG9076762.1 sulfatase-like hydrolase/transferase [Laribacter hongkongensis]